MHATAPVVSHDPWSLSEATMGHIWDHLLQHTPNNIVEFGSGYSTWMFALYANEHPAATVTSIEDDPIFLDRTMRLLENSANMVRLILAPITSRYLGGRIVDAYSLVDSDLIDRIDFCLIDGPSGQTGRYGSLSLVSRHLADGAYIFIDDANRPAERQIVADWLDEYDEFILEKTILDERGLIIGRWR
jgi:predicted O-methyltransferase YrrM